MKKIILVTTVLQMIVLVTMSCNSTSTKEKINQPIVIITNNGVDEFRLNTDITKYDLSKYNSIVDTSALLSEDEVEKTQGKIIYFNKYQYLVLWLNKNIIAEIDIKTDGFSTKDGLTVGMSFETLFNKIHKNYEFYDDFNFSFCLPTRNILFVISNSTIDMFSDKEINDLYKNVLSIKSNQLEKMKVERIIIRDFNRQTKQDEMDY